ncbi:27494_t:CDS:2, partial [Racocetra persica]
DDTILENGATIQELMLPIYENANASDVIKIGVLCTNDRLYENYPYNLILKKYQQNLDDLVPSSEISERISKRINEISDISDIKEAERVIKSWHNNDELFSNDFDASILNFIRNLFEKTWRFFGLESRYWDFNHTEGHISSALMFETELFANKERRNRFKTLSDNLLRALIPDITVTNLEFDVEFLIVKHGKLLSLNDKKKELGDTAKSCTMLHDMIRRIHNNLTFCGSQSVKDFENFKVIAVVTSALEIKVFTLNLAGKELYIFQQIAGCTLPPRVQMYNSQLLRDNIITLIKIRILPDKNFNIYNKLYKQQSSNKADF